MRVLLVRLLVPARQVLRHDGRIEGLFFALLARVLSFVADNRDTQESMRWRLGSPAIKGGVTILVSFRPFNLIPPETDQVFARSPDGMLV
jgi:hypothetical protein